MSRVTEIAKKITIELLTMVWAFSLPPVILLGGLYAIFQKPLWVFMAFSIFLPFRFSDIKKAVGWRKALPVLINAGIVIFIAGCITSMMFMYLQVFHYTLATGAVTGLLIAIVDLLFLKQKFKAKIFELIRMINAFLATKP